MKSIFSIKFNSLIIVCTMSLMSSSCRSQAPETVSSVDLEKYAGLWYEYASFPTRFQKGCRNTTAEYKISPKGYVIVINKCTRDKNRGGIEGKAFVVKGSGNAKLKVQFFWPFKGDYWILELAEDYSWAAVGSPKRNYLWILTRTPVMDENLYKEITDRVAKKGFDISKLQKTAQDQS
jgi:apolipoprotein D and lipocalin family protein